MSPAYCSSFRRIDDSGLNLHPIALKDGGHHYPSTLEIHMFFFWLEKPNISGILSWIASVQGNQ